MFFLNISILQKQIFFSNKNKVERQIDNIQKKGCSSIDSDKDGIIDDLDYCPDTPSWTNVNWEWCPDADSDWIQDGKDKCPSTPKWAKVDGDWCPKE